MMDRRTFVYWLTLGTFSAPLTADAQQPGRVVRIGLLGGVPFSDPESARIWGGFIQGLRDLGYVEGQNITIERRAADAKYEQLSPLAADLVRLKVDVIVVGPTPGLAAKQATRTIPIVLVAAPDPVGQGLVASLARPGGNVTGLSSLAPEIVGKQLEILKEIAPGVSRMAVLSNPADPRTPLFLGEARSAARSLGVQLQPLEVRGPDDFERVSAAITQQRAGAILILNNAMFYLHRARVADLVVKTHLPAMSGLRELTEAGSLISYGVNLPDLARRAATYVNKILKGVKPTDLPVEQPTKFELVINLKTAKTFSGSCQATFL
jgi:putative tryptophan/tyrosine transport system substrate-binding protein